MRLAFMAFIYFSNLLCIPSQYQTNFTVVVRLHNITPIFNFVSVLLITSTIGIVRLFQVSTHACIIISTSDDNIFRVLTLLIIIKRPSYCWLDLPDIPIFLVRARNPIVYSMQDE